MESKQKVRIGHVVSDKMDKTVVVAVETLKRHPLYKKTFKKVVKYKAHDEDNKCKVGDKVRIIATKEIFTIESIDGPHIYLKDLCATFFYKEELFLLSK